MYMQIILEYIEMIIRYKIPCREVNLGLKKIEFLFLHSADFLQFLDCKKAQGKQCRRGNIRSLCGIHTHTHMYTERRQSSNRQRHPLKGPTPKVVFATKGTIFASSMNIITHNQMRDNQAFAFIFICLYCI